MEGFTLTFMDEVNDKIDKLGLTLYQISRHLGMDEQEVSDYLMSRKNPPFNFIFAICDLLDLDITEYVATKRKRNKN